MLILKVLLLAAVCSFPARATLNNTPTTTTWVTNGCVNAIARTSSTIYLGGNFSRVGPATGGFAALSAATGQLAPNFPKVCGRVEALCGDGAGGWYIGGNFWLVGGLERHGLAHILPDGSVDPAFNHDAENAVEAMVLLNNVLYFGGEFTTVDGQTRNHLAAIDCLTGTLNAWNPNAYNSYNDGYVVINSMTTANVGASPMIFVGGDFNSMGGQQCICLAGLNTTSGALKWSPTVNGPVKALAVQGKTLYVAGSFSWINGVPHGNLAAVDLNTMSITAWNPNPVGGVETLAVSGNTVYAGGTFISIGGQARKNLAALDASSGAATAWNPAVGSEVCSCALSGSGDILYIGGTFGAAGGQTRNCIAAIDTATGAATAWNPNANEYVFSVAVSGGTVFAGGDFSCVGGLARSNLAAIDIATGAATAWNPGPNGGIGALAVVGGTVYAAGAFTSIGGQMRNYLAALDALSGAATAWNPNANSSVWKFVVSGGTAYVAGGFTSIGEKARNQLAALDLANGSVLPWNPGGTNDSIDALAVSGGTVYLGGWFTTIGGVARNHLAALDSATGTLQPWNPDSDGDVYSLAVSGGTIYAGGWFSSVGGQARESLAALDASTGAVKGWHPQGFYRNYALAVSGSTVYVGGACGVEAVDATSGAVRPWNPNAYNTVYSLLASGSSLYVGGVFPGFPTQPQSNFAQFDGFPPSAAPAQPHATLIDPTSIRWEWDDVSNNEDGFKVWADPGTGAPATLRTTAAAGETRWRMTGLSANTQYTFQVAATNDAGDSARTAPYTTWTLIQPVGELAFPTVTATSLAVAPVGTFSNLTAGFSGIYISNDTAGTASNWQQSTAPWVSGGLTPNTAYTFRSRSRNGARVSGASHSAYQFTLPPPPVAGRNVACDQTTGSVYLIGTTFTFSNPAGFGASTHGGNAYKVSGYYLTWDTNPVYNLTVNNPVWTTGTLAITPDSPGSYYLHLLALNSAGAPQPATLHYGPFTIKTPGQLAASPASLGFREGSPWAVDVEKGGAPTQKTLTLTNPGQIAVTFSGGTVATPGLRLAGPAAADFQIAAVTPSSATPLAPGGSLTVTIRFAPGEKQRTLGLGATLEVTCDSPVTPTVSIPLTGDAVPVELSGFSVE